MFFEREIAPRTSAAASASSTRPTTTCGSRKSSLRVRTAYTQSFNFNDIGRDGVASAGDDRVIPLLGIPTAVAAANPVATEVVTVDRPERFKTVEASMSSG